MLKNMDDLIDLTIEEVLDVLQIDHHLFERRGSSKLERVIKKKGLKN